MDCTVVLKIFPADKCLEHLAPFAEPTRMLTQPYIQWDIRLARSLASHQCTDIIEVESRSIGPPKPQTLRRGSFSGGNFQLNGHSNANSLENLIAVLSFVMDVCKAMWLV